MLNPGVFLERPSHAFWFEPCGTLIIWRSVFSTLCKVERLALDTGLQGTKCNQDIGLSHCFILNRFFHSLYVRCDVAIIFYTIKDHRHDVCFFFVFILLSLTLSVKTLFFRIKQINCKSTRLLRFYRYKSFKMLSDSFFPYRTATNLLLGFIIMCLQLSVCLSVKNRATFSIGICIWLHFLISHLCTV